MDLTIDEIKEAIFDENVLPQTRKFGSNKYFICEWKNFHGIKSNVRIKVTDMGVYVIAYAYHIEGSRVSWFYKRLYKLKIKKKEDLTSLLLAIGYTFTQADNIKYSDLTLSKKV